MSTEQPVQPEPVSEQKEQESQPQQFSRPMGRGRGRGRGRGGRPMGGRPMQGGRPRPMRLPRNFTLDFEWFKERNPETHKKISENLEHRMSNGDSKELFHWSSPQINNLRVGNLLQVKFPDEESATSYIVSAKFLGTDEVSWVHSLPTSCRYTLRLKKVV